MPNRLGFRQFTGSEIIILRIHPQLSLERLALAWPQALAKGRRSTFQIGH
jgi:hypothetical protein